MNEFVNDRLRRKLIARRGRLHAFPQVDRTRSAVVVIDAVTPSLEELPERTMVVDAVNRLTEAARGQGCAIVWVLPTPPSTWRSAAATSALLGPEQIERHQRQMVDGGVGWQIAPGLFVHETDWRVHKTGYSAFYPGNCTLPEQLRQAGIDTVIFAGILTHVCVEASARDAHEAGFRVLVCSDGVTAYDQEEHRSSLRILARCYADVRSADEIRKLFGA